jgi:transporter family-2 protein
MMILVLCAALIGVLLPVQAGVNAELRHAVGSPLGTAFASFLVGTVALGIVGILARSPVPDLRTLGAVPAWQWLGGLLGAVYITGAVVLAPRLGAATMIAAIVAGQMLSSVVLDHFGWVGFARHSATPARLVGAALVILGVRLIQR